MESLVAIPDDLLSGAKVELSGDLVVGVDGGATKTLAAVWDPGQGRVATGTGGPSNPDAVGSDAAAEAIRTAVTEALGRGRAHQEIAAGVFAIAGIDTEAVAATVDRIFDSMPTYTVNDVVAAWASATDGQAGVGAIAGTGMNVLGVGRDGATWRSGGWGHILDDEGSAYWLGVEGIRAALAHRDASGPATALTGDATDHFDAESIEDVAALVHAKPVTKGELASFARRVAERAEAGDDVAAQLLASAGRHLATRVVAVIQRTGLDDGAPFTVGRVGSTWKAGPLMLDPFEEAVRAVAPAAEFRTVSAPPVYGSLLLAARAARVWSDDRAEELLGLLEDHDT